MSKPTRQNVILKLVDENSLDNQESLRKALGRQGFKVTQATLSRDIRELGLVKTVDGYRFPGKGPGPLAVDQALPSANRLVREFVIEVREAQNLLVIKTAVGSAQPVAASLDGEGWTEIVGTIAGDDTILIVTADNKSAQRLANRVREMLN